MPGDRDAKLWGRKIVGAQNLAPLRRGIRLDSPCVRLFAAGGLGVFAIKGPLGRVVEDILTDVIEGFVVADDVFEVVSLPHVVDGGV